MRKNLFYYSLIVFIALLDQAAKWAVASRIPLYSSLNVIPGFFSLTRIHNKGAIFGAFSQTNNRYVLIFLTVASLAALGLVIAYFFKTPASERLTKLALSLILAGALGNLIDRVFRGYVIDFLDFFIKSHHWPFFNVADSSISVGACLLLISFVIRKPSCSPSSSV